MRRPLSSLCSASGLFLTAFFADCGGRGPGMGPTGPAPDDNLLPALNRDQDSSVLAPLPVAASARITTYTVGELAARVLPAVGTRNRNAREQALLDEIAARLGGACGAAPIGTRP